VLGHAIKRLGDHGTFVGRKRAPQGQAVAVWLPPPAQLPPPVQAELRGRDPPGGVGSVADRRGGDSPGPRNELVFVFRGGKAGQLDDLVERQHPVLEGAGDGREAFHGVAGGDHALCFPGRDAVAQRDPLSDVAAVVVLPQPGLVAGDDEGKMSPLRAPDRGRTSIEALEELWGRDGVAVVHGHLFVLRLYPTRGPGAPPRRLI
jgi:hypothetical protein